MSLEEWQDQTPIIYREKLTYCLSLLEDANAWTEQAIVNEKDEAIKLDYLDDLRIENLSNSVLHQTFATVCRQLHSLCPHNLYLKFALIRLYKSYAVALEAVEYAQKINQCDRLEYLKRITRDYQ